MAERNCWVRSFLGFSKISSGVPCPAKLDPLVALPIGQTTT